MAYSGPFNRLYVRQLVRDHNANVGGVSEVSRCIGNAYLKRAPFTLSPTFQVPHSELAPSDFTWPLLSAEPAISSRVLKDTHKFIIFGSGGLFKLLTNEQTAKIVHTNPRDVCMVCSFYHLFFLLLFTTIMFICLFMV
jgi:serine/threonine protein phosphatase PrpC